MADEAFEKLQHSMWRDAWKSLSYREQQCLTHWLRLGRADSHYLTRKELAGVFGISVSHLRRISLRAARKFDVARVLTLVATEEGER